MDKERMKLAKRIKRIQERNPILFKALEEVVFKIWEIDEEKTIEIRTQLQELLEHYPKSERELRTFLLLSLLEIRS